MATVLFLRGGDRLRGVAVSGPGEALANAGQFPEIVLSIATYGLLLRDRIEQVACGIRNVAVSINAFLLETATRIYSRILYIWKGRRYPIKGVAAFLLACPGILLGVQVTVHTLVIPAVNENEMVQIAKRAGTVGVKQMQIFGAWPDAGEGELDNGLVISLRGLQTLSFTGSSWTGEPYCRGNKKTGKMICRLVLFVSSESVQNALSASICSCAAPLLCVCALPAVFASS